MRRLVLALVLLSGCARFPVGPLLPFPSPVREGQEQAAWIVWHSYGREDLPPSVRWVEGAALTCTASTGRPGWETPVGCREGFTWTGSNVSVAWRSDDFFATTALAHEMAHCWLLRTRGLLGGDSNHTDQAVWGPGGMKDRAVGLLEEAGL